MNSGFKKMVLSLLAVIIFIGLLMSAYYFLPSDSTLASVVLDHSNTTSLSSGLVDYWSMDGSTISWSTGKISDLSGNGNTASLTGISTTTSSTAGKIGSAIKFNGSNSLLTVANSTSDNFTGSFTIAVWMDPAAWNNSSSAGIVSKKIDGQQNGYGYVIYDDGSTSCPSPSTACAPLINMRMEGASGNYNYLYSASSVTVGAWQQWVAVYNASAQTFTWYKNGVPDKTWTSVNTGNMTNTLPLLIGESQNWSGYYNGKLDDLRLYNRALSSQEIAQLYKQGSATLDNSNTSTSTSVGLNSGLVGYWPLDGNTTNWKTDTTSDMSGNGNTGTLVSMSTTTSPVAGKIGGALKFNGSDEISKTTPAGFNTGATARSMAAWIKITGSTGSNAVPFVYGSCTPNGGAFGIYIDASRVIHFWGCGDDFQTTTTLALNTWYNVAITTSNGSSVTIWVNGVPVYTAAPGNGVLASPSGTSYWEVGGAENVSGSTPYYFNGIVDDARVYSRALSAQEIAQLYAQGSATVDHSNTNTALGINSGLTGYWPLDGNTTNWATGITQDMSGSGHNGTLVSMSTSTSPTAGKIGQALKFNGSNDVSVSASALVNNSAAYTLAAWFKTTVSGVSSITIMGLGYTLSSYPFTRLSLSAGIVGFQISDNNNNTVEPLSTATYNDGKWHLAVGTRTGNVLYLYIDGQLVATSSTATIGAIYLNTTSIGALIRNTTLTYFTGSVDDVRIYNRALSAQEVAQLYAMGK